MLPCEDHLKTLEDRWAFPDEFGDAVHHPNELVIGWHWGELWWGLTIVCDGLLQALEAIIELGDRELVSDARRSSRQLRGMLANMG